MSEMLPRQYDRLPSRVEAELRLANGLVQQGRTRDMGLGGVYLVTQTPPAAGITRGLEGKLAMVLFDRPVELPCRIAHVHADGIGLELERIYQA